MEISVLGIFYLRVQTTNPFKRRCLKNTFRGKSISNLSFLYRIEKAQKLQGYLKYLR